MNFRNLILWTVLVASAFVALPSSWADSASTTTVTMSDAIAQALRSNIDVRIADARGEEARGRVLREAADLLPQITGSAHQSRVFKVNLESQGFDFPGMDPLIGPFNSFDARLRLSQKVFDMASIQRTRSATASRRMADAESALAREHVAAAAALAYLEALRAQAAVTSAQAGATLAHTLLKQVESQRQAGAAAGIDVARGRTRAAEEELRVLQAQSQVHDAVTRLKRVMGLPLAGQIQLTDPFEFTEMSAIVLDSEISTAKSQRAEMQVARESLKESQLALSSQKWESAPAVSASGDYGASGNDPGNAKATGSVGVDVQMPLFTSGRLAGGRETARAQAKQAEARLKDTEVQVEEDVRLAADQLGTTAEQVKTADQAVHLAEAELKMARNRFEAGVGSNVDIVDAQTRLARVQDEHIAALAAYEAARINHAMALGAAQKFRL